MLEIIGFATPFIMGVVVGAGIMYGFEVYSDWKEEQEEEK